MKSSQAVTLTPELTTTQLNHERRKNRLGMGNSWDHFGSTALHMDFTSAQLGYAQIFTSKAAIRVSRG